MKYHKQAHESLQALNSSIEVYQIEPDHSKIQNLNEKPIELNSIFV